MEDILKIVKSLEDSGLLLKGACETIKNEAKEQKRGFLSMLLGTLVASLLGNMLAGKGVMRAGETTILELAMETRDFHFKKFLIPPHTLTNFEIQMYYQNEFRFNGVYSRDNLPDKIKDGAYGINLNAYSDIRTHWIALYVNTKTVTYFDSFGLNIFQKKSKILLKIKT